MLTWAILYLGKYFLKFIYHSFKLKCHMELLSQRQYKKSSSDAIFFSQIQSCNTFLFDPNVLPLRLPSTSDYNPRPPLKSPIFLWAHLSVNKKNPVLSPPPHTHPHPHTPNISTHPDEFKFKKNYDQYCFVACFETPFLVWLQAFQI